MVKTSAVSPVPPLKADFLRTALIDYAQNSSMEGFKVLNPLLSNPDSEIRQTTANVLLSEEMDDYAKMQLLRFLQGYPKLDLIKPLSQLAIIIPNVNHKKNLLLAISKYDSLEALQALHHLNSVLKNSMLKDVITLEVNRIRQINPSAALIERFLVSSGDHTALQNVLTLLRKHLRLEQAAAFRQYLQHEQETLRLAAFTLLCDTDNESGSEWLFPIFLQYFDRADEEGHTVSSFFSLYDLAKSLLGYLNRYPLLVHGISQGLQDRFFQVQDPRLHELLMSIFLLAPDNRYLQWVFDLYRRHAHFREYLLPRLAKIPAAGEFLVSEYHHSGELLGPVTAALLNNEYGASYLRQHLLEQSEEQIALVFRNLTVDIYPLFKEEVFASLKSSSHHLKEIALETVRKIQDRSAQSILFDPQQLPDYLHLGRPYLETILQVFPFKTLMHFVQVEAFQQYLGDCPYQPIEAFTALAVLEPVLNLRDKAGFTRFVVQQLNFSSPGRVTLLLKILQSIKTIHLFGIRTIQEALNLYQDQRGQLMSFKEQADLKTSRDIVGALQEEVRELDAGYREMDAWMKQDPVNLESLDSLLHGYPVACCLRSAALIGKLRQYGSTADGEGKKSLACFLDRFPVLAGLLRSTDQEPGSDPFKPPAAGLPSPPRFHIIMTDKQLQFLLMDQFEELCPGLPSTCDESPQATDILIGDHDSFMKIDPERLEAIPKKYLILKNPGEYADLKKFKPVTFPVPISLYRMAKTILQNALL